MNDTIASYIDRIRNAYRHAVRDHGQQPGDWLMLSDLRPYVGGHRPYVDEALRQLGRESEVTIIPESNQKMLTADQRAGSVRIGDQDKHLISIG